MTVQRIPDNYPRLSPYLSVDGAEDAIAFYCDVRRPSRRRASCKQSGAHSAEHGPLQAVNANLPHSLLPVAVIAAIFRAQARPALPQRQPVRAACCAQACAARRRRRSSG